MVRPVLLSLCCLGLALAAEGGASRRLVAAVPADFAPSSFSVEGKASGFTVQVVEAVAGRCGCEIAFVFGRPWDELQEMLASRRADCIPSLIVTPERQQRFIFTQAIESIAIAAVVRRESPVAGLHPGLRVGVLVRSAAEELVGAQPGLEILHAGSQQQLLMELLAGRVDAIVGPTQNILKLAREADLDDRIRVLSPPLSESRRAIAFRPEDADLCRRFDEALAGFVGTDEYRALYQHWWGRPSSWWTGGRIAWIMGMLLLLAVAGLLVWRFRSLRAGNHALREREAMLLQAQQAAQLGVYAFDIRKGTWTASPTLDRILGLPSEPCHPYAVWVECIHPEDREAMAAYVRDEVIGTGRPFDREYRIVRLSDGAVRWMHGRGELDVGRDGQPERLYGIIQDVTDRRQAAEAVREAARRYETLFHGSRDALFVADPHTGRIVDANRQAEQLLGRPRDGIIGMHQSSLHPEDLREELVAAFRQHADGGFNPVEAEVQHRDGSRIPVEINASIIPVAGGGSLLLGIFRDIRERVRFEERLRQAEKLTAIGQLAGGVAHDFNNQLAGIAGFAELLAGRVQDPQHRRWAEGILGAAARAADLTRQLLAFARKGQSLRAPVDLNRTVAEVVELLSRSIDRRIAIESRLDAVPATTCGDPGQLHHALVNLGVNARDAMPGGGRLMIATRNVLLPEDAHGFGNAAGAFIEIAVTDTGCGMDEEVRRHLFEPFFTTKERGKGTGLGLAAVYGVVRNHGGVITVDSEPGVGTTFLICLPQHAVAAVPANGGSSSTRLAAIAPRRHAILVVDDEAVVREMTREMLDVGGYAVEVADGGAAAIARCAAGPLPDLVILDLVMPGQGGRETFLALRERHPGLRVLISSGHSINGEAQELLDRGAVGFIQKPFRLKALSEAVEGALG